MILPLWSFIFWTEPNWFMISRKIERSKDRKIERSKDRKIERSKDRTRPRRASLCTSTNDVSWTQAASVTPLIWWPEPVFEDRESVGNPTQSFQDEMKRFRQAAKSSCMRHENHLSDQANRGIWHHFKCLQNCIVCNRETLIFRSILGFWFISQNDIVPDILCHDRICDGIRPEYVYNFDMDIFDFGWNPLQVEKHDG
jgi:hypothetical protein